ncbi:hypothetical protein VTK26DRAFT_6194 [Humicola hyalothermophila]
MSWNFGCRRTARGNGLGRFVPGASGLHRREWPRLPLPNLRSSINSQSRSLFFQPLHSHSPIPSSTLRSFFSPATTSTIPLHSVPDLQLDYSFFFGLPLKPVVGPLRSLSPPGNVAVPLTSVPHPPQFLIRLDFQPHFDSRTTFGIPPVTPSARTVLLSYSTCLLALDLLLHRALGVSRFRAFPPNNRALAPSSSMFWRQ